MALSAAMVWELRTTGLDTNGGAFKAGASGIDYSTQITPQVAIDNSAITTSITTTVITFTAGYSVTGNETGNIVQMATGTNVTAGFYEITGTNTGAGTWTVDRNIVTSGTTTNATGKMGGCLLTFSKLSGAMVSSNKAWVQTGTYTEGAITFSATGVTPSNSVTPNWLIGYNATRGDLYPGSSGTRPTFSYNNTATALTFSGGGWWVENLIVQRTTSTMATCITFTSTHNQAQNCYLRDFTTTGITGGNTNGVFFTEATLGSGASAKSINLATGAVVANTYLHDTTGGATSSAVITHTTNGYVIGNIIDTVSGSTSHGVNAGVGSFVALNTIYNCGGDAVRMNTTMGDTIIKGNIFEGNTGYGINQPTNGWLATWMWDGNAFFNNTAGARNQIDSVAGNYNSAPYTNSLDQTLTGSPFTSASGADFSLNNTASAGAACRATGTNNSYPGLSTTGYNDMGPIQHQDTTSGSGSGYVLVE